MTLTRYNEIRVVLDIVRVERPSCTDPTFQETLSSKRYY